MATDRSFQAQNARERERLEALVERLSGSDLQRLVGHGWTVAATLVHLAFWDLRALTLLDTFEREGVRRSEIDVEVANAVILALARSIPPEEAARLVAATAEELDRRIEALPDDMIEAIRAAGNPFNLPRHLHRTEHLDEIERALSPSGGI